MAGPTRISELSDGSPVQPTDQVPVARGSGATGYTYKVNAGRFVSDLFNVGNSSTVDLTFDTSTRTLCAAANIPEATVNVVDSPTIDLDWNSTTRTLSADVSTAVKEASAFNVVDSPTIDLDWNASTRTLSADASYLLTLINTLSTNMQNIGNYPYLEYAWVTAPNAAGQTLTANTSAILTLNTEVVDSGNYGSITSNQITLSAGTYLIKGLIPLNIYGSTFGTGIVFVRNVTTGQFITRFGASAGNTTESIWFLPEFQSTFSTITTLEFGIITTATSEIQNQVETYGFGAGTSTFTNLDQRTTIKLWKVG